MASSEVRQTGISLHCFGPTRKPRIDIADIWHLSGQAQYIHAMQWIAPCFFATCSRATAHKSHAKAHSSTIELLPPAPAPLATATCPSTKAIIAPLPVPACKRPLFLLTNKDSAYERLATIMTVVVTVLGCKECQASHSLVCAVDMSAHRCRTGLCLQGSGDWYIPVRANGDFAGWLATESRSSNPGSPAQADVELGHLLGGICEWKHAAVGGKPVVRRSVRSTTSAADA